MNKSFYIAGVQHHNSNDVLNELKEGGKLALVPEPTNKFDANAIRIQLDQTMLGYVPAKFAASIGAAMTINPALPCTITTLNPDSKPWERIEVTIGEPEDDFEDEDNLQNEEY